VIRTGNNKVSYRKQIVRQQLSQKNCPEPGVVDPEKVSPHLVMHTVWAYMEEVQQIGAGWGRALG